MAQLTRPGRDPREDLPPPIFKRGVLKLDDLQTGMELFGSVLNVVDFGAFVDIGLHDSGLVHVSQLANRFVRDPHDVVSVGDIVKVWVVEIDKTRRRVSLTRSHRAHRGMCRNEAPPAKRRIPNRNVAAVRHDNVVLMPPDLAVGSLNNRRINLPHQPPRQLRAAQAAQLLPALHVAVREIARDILAANRRKEGSRVVSIITNGLIQAQNRSRSR